MRSKLMGFHRRRLQSVAAILLLAGLLIVGPVGGAPSASAAVPSGFQETTAFSGLTNPTVVRFASDGRVFVAEKSGLIKVFDNLSDTSPTVFADLQTKVHNFWDRGLLGMALDPNFPTNPYVYVLYAYDHELGSPSSPPRWGDGCPTPPGATTDGCVVSGRLSRLQASGNVMTGSEQVLVEDWCHQFPSHSVGTVEFGPDGALYASGGDGASFTFVDYGQAGSPRNPCGDPPGGVGSVLTPPTAEGGSLRSQDLRTSGDAATLDGSIIRVDPTTGAGLPDNPFAGSADPNTRRIIGYGLRNPFRFTFRSGTSELWIGDVGWNDYEEVNRILNPTDAVVENFGWPCYEGNAKQDGYDQANLAICENLYNSPSADTKPFFAYHHSNKVVPGEGCAVGSSSVSGLAFEFAPTGGTFPAAYQGALFFADYSRDCIWVMRKNGNPIPSPGSIDTFVDGAANPVNLQFGPGGDLFYVDFDGGTIRRIHYLGANQPPTAVASASPTSGPVPLTVNFNGSSSSDPDGTIASYAWDLDGDGQFDDSTAQQPSFQYTAVGTYTVRLRVTDNGGLPDDSDPLTITATSSGGGSSYSATVLADSPLAYWRLGETSGTSAADSSGNNRTGSYLGSPSLGQPGALAGDANKSVGFNGSSQYVNVPYAAALNPAQVTVEAWAYPTGGQGSYRSVVTSRDIEPMRGYTLYAASDNTWQFWLGTGTNAWSIVSGPAIALNQWTHLVATYSGGTARLYVNGVLAGSSGATYAPNTQRPLRIASGATDRAPEYFLPGRVDEVAVYGSALAAARVQAHYTAGTGG